MLEHNLKNILFNYNAERDHRKMSEEKRRCELVCKLFHLQDIGDFSDGFHTFNELYYQRMMLFAYIVNSNKEISWKTRRHEDGEECFGGGWFLVTVETPEGPYGYHYEDKYWDYFDCKELEKAKPFDGYTEKDVTRLLSLL